MTVHDLKQAWPEYPATHDITDSELERIARAASCADHANDIWSNHLWWADSNNPEKGG